MTGLVRLVAAVLLRRPAPLVLVALAVAAGVSVWSGVLVTNRSIDDSGARTLARLAGPGGVRVVGPTLTGGLTGSDVVALREVYGTDAVIPVVTDVTTVRAADGSDSTVLVLGVDCAWPGAGELGCRSEVLTALGTAPLAVGPGVDAGSGVRLASDVGPLPVEDSVPIRPDLADLNGGRVVVLGLPGASEAFSRGDAVDSVFVRSATLATASDPLRSVRSVVPRARSASTSAADWPEVRQLLATVRPVLDLMALLALVVVVLVCGAVVRAEMETRRRDLAVVAAVGAEPWRVGLLAAVPSLLAGVAGGAAGGLAARFAALPMVASVDAVTRPSVGLHVEVANTPWAVAGGTMVGTVVVASAGWAAARRAAAADLIAELDGRRDPAAVEATRRTRRVRRAAVAAQALGAAGLIAALAGGGLHRWQGRLAGPALVLLMAGLLAGWSGVVMAVFGRRPRLRSGRWTVPWLGAAAVERDHATRALAVLCVAATVSLATVSSSLVASVSATARANADGPDHVATDQRVGDAAVAALDAAGLGRPQEVWSRLVLLAEGLVVVKWTTGGEESFEALAGSALPGDARIGSGLARLLDIGPGDRIELAGVAGARRVRVGEVWDDGTFGARNVTVDEATARAVFGPGGQRVLRWSPDGGGAATATAAAVRRVLGSDAPQLRTRGQVADRAAADARAAVAPLLVLQLNLVVASVVVLAAMSSTLVRRRRKELATLVAVGAPPGTVARLVSWEGVSVGALAAGCGALAGVALSVAVVRVAPFWLGPRLRTELDVGVAWGAGLGLWVLVVVVEALVAWSTARTVSTPGLAER